MSKVFYSSDSSLRGLYSLDLFENGGPLKVGKLIAVEDVRPSSLS
jgi:hypothetical protein